MAETLAEPMETSPKNNFQLPPEQQAIRDKCFHPSGTFVEFPIEDVESSIPARFEKIAKTYPDQAAVVTNRLTVTYRQLNAASNQVARAVLRQCGSGNQPVAIFLEHEVIALATILGVLKAGKIYVPLDSSFPMANIASIVADSQARLLVARRQNLELLQSIAQNGLDLLPVDADILRSGDSNLQLALAPDTLASILYTSGSTGKPKGVFKDHRGILYNIRTYTNDIHVSIQDRLTLLHSCATNASVRNLLGALLNGATLYPFDLRSQSLANLAAWLEREGITIFHAAASVFRALTDVLSGAALFDTLRLIQLSNEAVTAEDVRRFKKYFPATCIFANRLGTTETDTFSRWLIANDGIGHSEGAVPAGFPCEGTEIFLVDENRNAVGAGTVGEIVVKSRHLALGYWRQVELSMAKFVPDPEGGEERLYFTGDLGRLAADGCLYHLGRKDFTVKLRGQSVILSQIETALAEHPAVKQVAVSANSEPTGDQQLVAYVVAGREPGPTSTELRDYLRQKFPDAMVPSAFIMVASLPLTAAGKIDRTKLSSLAAEQPRPDRHYTAPGTATEITLAAIWAEILHTERVGIHDNFFDLGGHSLTASRVISRVVQTFKLDLPLKALFDAPTVAQMAQVVDQHQGQQILQEELERLLAEVEAMTEAEAQKALADKGKRDDNIA